VNARRKKRRRLLVRRKRTLDPSLEIDYKNPDTLKRFITDRGKIIPRRISGATNAQQHAITVAVKRARFLSLIPYGVSHKKERGFAGEMTAIAQTFAATAFKARKEGRGGDHRGDRRPPRTNEGER
jgi:small subunit ribosomal protein S18